MEAALLTALINNLVTRLSSLVDEKMKLYEGFQDDANFLRRELPMIASAIDGQLSGQDDHILRLSVEELRQIAHYIEDCIDHITYRASWNQQGLQYRFRISGKKKKTFTELAKKMGQLKERLDKAHERNMRYHELRPAPTLQPLSSSDSEYHMHPEYVVGLQAPLEEVNKHLSEQEEVKQLKVIVIVGFCGLGKTVLAHELCEGTKLNSEVVDTEFEIQICWVSAVHKQPTDLLKEMHKELQMPLPFPSNSLQLTEDLKNHLSNKRYFIVFDDMQTKEQRAAITVFPRDINATIVVTTKIQSVAANLCDLPNCYVYNMGKLSDNHSKQLLLKEADLDKYPNPSPSDSKAILTMCDGQPLALSAVGKFMRARSFMEDPEWEGMCNKVRCNLGRDDSLKRVNQALMHEYTSLPSCAIKACMLYFAMFPSDRVRTQRIMRHWLAEGFVEPGNSRGDTADECFKALQDRSIVHPIEISINNKKVKTCRTYGMMHEYIMIKSLSENFIVLCDNGNFQNSKVNGNSQTKNNNRRLSLRGSGTTDSSSLDNDLSLVRTLIVFGEAGSMLNFDRYQLLRVLDLEECTDLQNDHVKKLCNLLLLKYLSLGGDVTSLPKKIENLKLLETLDLRGTAINTLPKEVFQLPHLTHLFGRFKLPDKNIPSEQCKLQMVKGFLVDEREGYDKFLGRMKKLQNVKIWCESSATNTSLTNLQKAIQEFIRDEKDAKRDPRSLSIQFDACFEDFLKGLQGQCYLRSLKLKGKLEELPGFVTRLRGLKELCLQSTKLTADLLTALGTLDELKYLKLIADELDDFVLQHNALPSLVRLRFVLKSPTLPTVQYGAMPKLKSLQLLCGGLNGLSGLQINNFKHLMEVILGVGVNSATIQNWQDAAVNHPNRPKVVLLNAPDTTEGPPREGSAESRAKKNGTETHMLPKGLNSILTESSIASNITVDS